MDSAHAHGRSSSSPSSVSGYASTVRFRQPSPPTPIEQSSSRQQRLMDSRNARFVGKKLSLNDLGTRFSQLIHASEEPKAEQVVFRNQENTTPTRRNSVYGIGPRKGSTRSLGILEEVSNTTKTRSPRKRGSIPIYLDTPERPPLDRSPASSPGVYHEDFSGGPSPIGFDSFQDSLNKMHLRETSGNEQRGSPMVSSPLTGPMKAIRKRRSMPFKPAFDAQEYINHIEQELQQARKDLYSPTSNKSLKDQLKVSRNENDRLRLEISTIRDTFETEVKNTVEHMMAVEAELKMKVRDLEEELTSKNHLIQEFEYKHEDERLNCNTVETLKTAIERLEQEKTAMENENRNMSKRNEVLSELLAMSPTKSLTHFELRSPVREKRAGRPMSMILPRLPSSPTFKTKKHSSSTATSPTPSTLDYFQLPASYDNLSRASSISRDTEDLRRSPPVSDRARSRQSQDDDAVSLVSGTLSRTSSSPAPWAPALPMSPTAETAPRQPPKRKPRKFMSGSTQLKPLLLPALTGDNNGQSSAHLLASPRSMTSRDFSQDSFDPTTYFLSRPESDAEESKSIDKYLEQQTVSANRYSDESVHYQTFDQILAEHEAAIDTSFAECSGLALKMPSRSSLVTQVGLGVDIVSGVGHSPDCPSQDFGDACQATKYNMVSLDGGDDQPRPFKQTNLSETLSPDFDGEALRSLELHNIEFSPFSPQPSETDGCLFTDIPQPLFSPVSKVSPTRILHRLDRTPFNGSPPRLTSRKRRQSRSTIHDSLTSFISDGPGPDILTLNPEFNDSPVGLQEKTIKTPASLQKTKLVVSCSPVSLTRSRSPLDLLQQRQFGARPLASLTIRTIYGAISRCTAYVRELKRDPLALARRVIANAWFSNWARFGKLSWWVLGLFISPVRIQNSLGWQWHQYDGDGIAQAICNDDTVPEAETHDKNCKPSASTAQASQTYAAGTEDAAKKPGWGKSLLLWGKFSVAIMLAVSSAVVNGPGEVLLDRGHQSHLPSHTDQNRASCTDKHRKARHDRSRSVRRDEGSTRNRKTRRRNHDRTTSAVLSDRASCSPLHHRSQMRSFTFRSYKQLDTCTQPTNFDRGDENDTLRPVKAQKIHAADIFPAKSSEIYKNASGFSDEPDGRSEAFFVDTGALQWHTSPDMICPEDSTSVRGQ